MLVVRWLNHPGEIKIRKGRFPTDVANRDVHSFVSSPRETNGISRMDVFFIVRFYTRVIIFPFRSVIYVSTIRFDAIYKSKYMNLTRKCILSFFSQTQSAMRKAIDKD